MASSRSSSWTAAKAARYRRQGEAGRKDEASDTSSVHAVPAWLCLLVVYARQQGR